MWQYNQTVYHADFNTEQRRRLASRGQAMPDGGFPIRNVSDLKNAIQAYGRATNKPAVKAWIKKRARALGVEDLLPDNWRDDIVKHYGVKGMKWGVRRYQNKDGSLTPLGKEHKKALLNNDDNLVQQSDGDYVLKKGTVVQRMSDRKETLRGQRTYISFLKADNEAYDQLFTDDVTEENPENVAIKNTYVTSKNLKLPSHKKVVDVFIDMYRQAPEYMNNMMGQGRKNADFAFHTSARMRDVLQKATGKKQDYKSISEFYVSRYKNMTLKELREDAYYDFMSALAVADEYVQNYFYDSIKKQGYDGIIDDNDKSGLGARGYDVGYLSRAPILLFNDKESLAPRAVIKSKKSRTPLDLDEINSEEFQKARQEEQTEYEEWVQKQIERNRR